MILLRPRERVTWRVRLAVPLLSLAVALLAWCALVAVRGTSPWTALATMARATTNRWGLLDSLVLAVPLVLAAAGIALAARMSLWNIGAEGQIILGAVAASAVALHAGDRSAWLVLPAMMLAGTLAGALWCAVCGALRAWLEVSEILSTLMLNYVALQLARYLLHGPWKGPDNFPQTAMFGASARLPSVGAEGAHLGILLTVGLVGLLYWLERRHVLGYELRVAGESPETARYAGIPVAWRVVGVLALAGALAGLAGAIEVAGRQHRMQLPIAGGVGYVAIIVCWLARRNLLGCLLVGFLLAGLTISGEALQLRLDVPASLTQVLQALVLLAVLAGELLLTHRPVYVGARR